MNKFKIDDLVKVVDKPSSEHWYKPECLGKIGRVVFIRKAFVTVSFPDLNIRQHIEPRCLELAEPVKAKKKRKVNSDPNSQISRILKYLLSGKPLTPVKAITLFGAYRLAARIHELRKAGHKIKAENKSDLNGRVYAEYTLRKAGRV